MQIITDQFQKEKKEHGNYSFPFLISREKLSKYESGSFLWHWHPEIELTLLVSGEMIYKINNDTFHITQEQALFGNSSTLHAGYMYQEKDCEYISITFDPKLVYGYENSLVYTKYIKPLIQNYTLPSIYFDLSQKWHAAAIDIIKDIINIGTEKEPAYELDIMMKLEQLWKLLVINNAETSENTIIRKGSYERLRDIISYVEQNYSSNITLDDISNTIHLCKSECSRMFKKHMNVSLFDFIAQYRIEKSLYYLTHTNLPVSEIATLVGFNDPNYFTKVFHKQKGCSPLKYRHSTQAVE